MGQCLNFAPMAEVNAAPQAFPSQYDESGATSFDKVEAELRGADLNLQIQLPDGTTVQIAAPMGQDVVYVKSHLLKKLQETNEDFQYGHITMLLDGGMMIDPLSLSDFPKIQQTLAAGSNVIQITAQLSGP